MPEMPHFHVTIAVSKAPKLESLGEIGSVRSRYVLCGNNHLMKWWTFGSTCELKLIATIALNLCGVK